MDVAFCRHAKENLSKWDDRRVVNELKKKA
jgi:hypothetical protein